jgi:hypothetical protein
MKSTRRKSKKAPKDMRIWICDTLNKVYFDARTTMTLKQFYAAYGSQQAAKTFINGPLPVLPHKGEWIVRLLYLPESYKGSKIPYGHGIYDEKITYVGITRVLYC